MAIHLVLGGARSGKTRYAEEGALAQASRLGLAAYYVATGVATDEEMRQRIATHRATRSQRYQTIERPRALGEWLQEPQTLEQSGVLLVDCLATYMGTALFDAGDDPSEEVLHKHGRQLVAALAAYSHPVWVVSNEVGMGIVPIYASTRLYRDVLGKVNSDLAAVARDVTLMVAGLPLPLKRRGEMCTLAGDD